MAEAAVSGDRFQEWSDPLDRQMDRASRAVMQVRDDSLVSTAGPGLIQYQFENIRKQIHEGSF